MKFRGVWVPQAARLGPMKQADHRVDEGVEAVVDHAAHDGVLGDVSVLANCLSGSEPAALCPAQRGPQIALGVGAALARAPCAHRSGAAPFRTFKPLRS